MIAFSPPPPTAPPIDPAKRERRAMIRWTLAITGMLVFGILLSVGGAVIAVHGMPMVEEDYYNKAIHWDDQLDKARASAALGWSADISVGHDATTTGERALILRLTDKSGAPIEAATVNVAFFHRADPLNLHQAQLVSTGNGIYAASVPLNRAGIWEFRLSASRPAALNPSKENFFVATLQKDLLE